MKPLQVTINAIQLGFDLICVLNTWHRKNTHTITQNCPPNNEQQPSSDHFLYLGQGQLNVIPLCEWTWCHNLSWYTCVNFPMSWKQRVHFNQGILKGGSLFDPCVNAMGRRPYWPSCMRLIIVPSGLVRSISAICVYHCYRVGHCAITYMRAWFKSTQERQLALNGIAWQA